VGFALGLRGPRALSRGRLMHAQGGHREPILVHVHVVVVVTGTIRAILI